MNLLILLLSEFSFCCVAVIQKKWRNANVGSSAIWASFIYLVPVFIFTAFAAYLTAEIYLNLWYFVFLLLWLVACLTHNFMRVYLYRFQSLSEFLAFDFLFSTLLVYVIDIAYFSYKFSIISFLGVITVLIGGVILHYHKNMNLKVIDSTAQQISLKNLIGLFALISIITAFSATMSKAAVSLQNPIFHGALANSILFFCFWLAGHKKLYKAVKANKIKKNTIFFCCLAMFVGSLAEAWAYKTLPLTVIAMAGLFIPITVYSSHDFYKKEIHMNKHSIIALILIIIGFIIYFVDMDL